MLDRLLNLVRPRVTNQAPPAPSCPSGRCRARVSPGHVNGHGPALVTDVEELGRQCDARGIPRPASLALGVLLSGDRERLERAGVPVDQLCSRTPEAWECVRHPAEAPAA